MTRSYLTLHDYGTGGIWVYLRAESEDEIHRKFRDLKVYEAPPEWMTETLRHKIEEKDTYDVRTAEHDHPTLARLLKPDGLLG